MYVNILSYIPAQVLLWKNMPSLHLVQLCILQQVLIQSEVDISHLKRQEPDLVKNFEVAR